MVALTTVSDEAARGAASSPAIRTQGLAKRYRAITALAGLTMTVPRGEVFGFLGPNGAGKTTSVKLLVGLTRATSGEGWVLGAPIGDRETCRRIGYLPELFRYQDWLSAREVLGLHCALAGIPGARRAGEMDRVLETVGLAARARDRVGSFSKGMQQRLGLGAALLGEPELVLLDEPTSALDPVGRHEVREIIRALKRRGTTVFLNSHLLTEVESVCDRAAVINKGSVIAQGTLQELLGRVQSVRLRLAGLTGPVEDALRRFGALSVAEGWHTVAGIEPDDVPAVVAEVVRLGARVYAVEPYHHNLEERFLELLEEANHAPADGRPVHTS